MITILHICQLQRNYDKFLSIKDFETQSWKPLHLIFMIYGTVSTRYNSVSLFLFSFCDIYASGLLNV